MKTLAILGLTLGLLVLFGCNLAVDHGSMVNRGGITVASTSASPRSMAARSINAGTRYQFQSGLMTDGTVEFVATVGSNTESVLFDGDPTAPGIDPYAFTLSNSTYLIFVTYYNPKYPQSFVVYRIVSDDGSTVQLTKDTSLGWDFSAITVPPSGATIYYINNPCYNDYWQAVYFDYGYVDATGGWHEGIYCSKRTGTAFGSPTPVMQGLPMTTDFGLSVGRMYLSADGTKAFYTNLACLPPTSPQPLNSVW